MNDLTIPQPTDANAIRSRILTIRGENVMLDRDLAELYGVPTRRLNEQVKRNIRRFPDSFMFQLTKEELEDWRSQIATSNSESAGRQSLVTFSQDDWKSQIATSNVEQYVKMGVRNRQNKEFPPQKIFYDGQIYDAFDQMKKFVRMARTELIIIDPYFADSVLPLIAQKRQGVAVMVVRSPKSKLLHSADVAAFNAQYGNSLTVKDSDKFHDRFLIIDQNMLIHVGASLNHLGKRCFAFASLDKSNIPDILAKI